MNVTVGRARFVPARMALLRSQPTGTDVTVGHPGAVASLRDACGGSVLAARMTLNGKHA
ncbi:MAG: hypothetical protein Q8O56_00525 [Solirubrobacteraceae bacterium]|nr:hypothetical protein [Solirubrobacteraceae bacterium]